MTGKTEFYCGLDLGQSFDFTALAIFELADVPTGEYEPIPGSHVVYPDGRSGREQREKTARRYDLRHLERFPLNTPYPTMARSVVERLAREPLASGEVTLAIDRTGVGRPVFDLFVEARPKATVVPISIHGGDEAIRDGLAWSTPKRDLIAAVQTLLQQGRLRIAPSLPEAATLVGELQDYQVKISAAGHDSYSAREGVHDDLVLAVALACWCSEKGRLPRWGIV